MGSKCETRFVVGDFNYWDGRRHPMRFHPASGVWELFLPKTSLGQRYKFELIDCNGNLRLKADPYAFRSELRPDTASEISMLPDVVEMTEQRRKANQRNQPISIYEVHLGSWRRNLENNFWLDYDQIADELIPYVKHMGFTHIEFYHSLNFHLMVLGAINHLGFIRQPVALAHLRHSVV